MSEITTVAQQDGPDHLLWKTHRSLTKLIPRDHAGYRGCMGLGMSMEGNETIQEFDASRIFASDAAIKWYVLQDIPRGKWATALNREVHLASVRRTGFRYGMPFIGKLEEQFDFRRCPYDSVVRDGVEVASDDECLKPSQHAQAFQTFNALEWAMTSTAFFYRLNWASKLPDFYEALGLEKSKKKQLLYGQEIFDECQPSRMWMPQPYLAFPAKTAKYIFERSTSTSLLAGRRNYPYAFKQAFLDSFMDRMPISAAISGKIVENRKGLTFDTMGGCRTIVIKDMETGENSQQPVLSTFVAKVPVGTVVAKGECIGWDGPAVPERFEKVSIYKRWFEMLPRIFGSVSAFESVLHLWFERQHVRLQKGYIHLPATIAAPAALTLADNSALQWNIAPAMPYYNEPLSSFIFPTLRLGTWNEQRLDLLPELELDVRIDPRDYRFLDWNEDAVHDPSAAPKRVSKTEKKVLKAVGLVEAKPAQPVVEAEPAINVTVVVEEGSAPIESAEMQAYRAKAKALSDRKIAERKARQAAKANRNGTAQPTGRAAYLTPVTPDVKDAEIEELARLLHLPQVDKATADNQPKAEALQYEHIDPKVAARTRRAYLPKTYSNQVDLASINDHDLEQLMAVKK